MENPRRLTLSRVLWADAWFAMALAGAPSGTTDPLLLVLWGTIFATRGTGMIVRGWRGVLFVAIWWEGVAVIYEVLSCLILLLITSPG